jgi:deoxyribonuclease-4
VAEEGYAVGLMKEKLLGAHIPISGGLGQAVRDGKAIGCTAIQIFTANPRQWIGKKVTPEMVEDMQAAVKETDIDCIVSHDTYLVNLCGKTEDVRKKSTLSLIKEMHRSSALGIHYVVSHMGAHLGQGEEEGIRLIAENTKIVLNETPKNVFLCMETTAGQGTSLGYRFEQLAAILEQCSSPKRLVVCLDTCHIFAAGYDIRTPETYEETFKEFDRIIGLDRLKVIHCNDSKKPLGSRIDRHEHIGKGCIGDEAFRLLVNDKRFDGIPLILETPEAGTMHQKNLDHLKSLIKK